MAGLNDNMKAAEKAVSYVKTILPLGASNAAEDVLVSGGGSSACMLSLRASYSDEVKYGPQTDQWIERVAGAAEYAGCGNCAEQCAVAIEFLLLPTTRIDALDFMGFDPSFFDHQFLVIGREKNSTVNKISTWGLNAVICDPWYPLFPDPTVNRRFYPAYEARSKMRMFLPAGEPTLQVLGRWDR
jgi:hypothetical protein